MGEALITRRGGGGGGVDLQHVSSANRQSTKTLVAIPDDKTYLCVWVALASYGDASTTYTILIDKKTIVSAYRSYGDTTAEALDAFSIENDTLKSIYSYSLVSPLHLFSL